MRDDIFMTNAEMIARTVRDRTMKGSNASSVVRATANDEIIERITGHAIGDFHSNRIDAIEAMGLTEREFDLHRSALELEGVEALKRINGRGQ